MSREIRGIFRGGLKTVPSSITWYESGLSGGITTTVQDINDSIYIGYAGFGTVWDIDYGTAGQPGWGYAGIEDFAGTAGIESNTTWDELISRSPISLVGVANGQESFYFSYRDDMNTFLQRCGSGRSAFHGSGRPARG